MAAAGSAVNRNRLALPCVGSAPRQDRRARLRRRYAGVPGRPARRGTEYTRGGHERQFLRAFQQGGAMTSRSEEHTSELQSLMRISYAVFCLKKKKIQTQKT